LLFLFKCLYYSQNKCFQRNYLHEALSFPLITSILYSVVTVCKHNDTTGYRVNQPNMPHLASTLAGSSLKCLHQVVYHPSLGSPGLTRLSIPTFPKHDVRNINKTVLKHIEQHYCTVCSTVKQM
jgi:hypothetical protein